MAGTGRPGPECRIGTLLRELPRPESAAIAHAMVNRDLSHAQLTDLMEVAGHNVSYSQVRWHRARRCRCRKAEQ